MAFVLGLKGGYTHKNWLFHSMGTEFIAKTSVSGFHKNYPLTCLIRQLTNKSTSVVPIELHKKLNMLVLTAGKLAITFSIMQPRTCWIFYPEENIVNTFRNFFLLS